MSRKHERLVVDRNVNDTIVVFLHLTLNFKDVPTFYNSKDLIYS